MMSESKNATPPGGPILYHSSARWTHGHQGRVMSPKKPPVEVVCPPPFCHERDDVWSPEEFYVSSVEMCLMMTFLYLAERAELPFLSYESRAEGVVEFVEGKAVFTRIDIYPRIEVEDARWQRKAGLMLKGAARNCLITNSIQTAVAHHPEIVVASPTETR